MKELQQKEDVGEHRMLLPELSSAMAGLHTFPPMAFEALANHERLAVSVEEKPPPPVVSRNEGAKDVGSFLAPGAMAALRAALAGKPPYETLPTRTDVTLPTQLRSEGRVPVLKTSTGAYVVAPTPPVSLSLANRPPPFPPRVTPNPPGVGLPPDHLFYTTPERRINLQTVQRPPLPPPPPKGPVSTYLVQAGGHFCIMSGAEANRSAEGRMLPIELSPHGISLTQPNAAIEAKTVGAIPAGPPPNVVPTHPTMYLKPMKTTVSLAPKLQTASVPRPPQPQLSQKLLERPQKPQSVEMALTSESFAARAENLKNLFMSGGNHIPVPVSLPEKTFAPLPPTDFVNERTDVSHKRRKTSTPASLDDVPYPMSAAQQAGLELLLQAAKSMGDPLPLDSDLPTRRYKLEGQAAVIRSFVQIVEGASCG